MKKYSANRRISFGYGLARALQFSQLRLGFRICWPLNTLSLIQLNGVKPENEVQHLALVVGREEEGLYKHEGRFGGTASILQQLKIQRNSERGSLVSLRQSK